MGRGHLSSSNTGAGNGSVATKQLAKSRGSGGDVTYDSREHFFSKSLCPPFVILIFKLFI